MSPNPFYQIYEGAAYLAGADLRFLNTLPENNFAFDYDTLSDEEWQRVQLLFVCSPGNPTGKTLDLEDWKLLFALSDKYGFIIASDECYSEIFFDEANPPLGCLQAARTLGRSFDRLVMFSSPVSYTHLDVYKRQIRNRSGRAVARSWVSPAFAAEQIRQEQAPYRPAPLRQRSPSI